MSEANNTEDLIFNQHWNNIGFARGNYKDCLEIFWLQWINHFWSAALNEAFPYSREKGFPLELHLKIPISIALTFLPGDKGDSSRYVHYPRSPIKIKLHWLVTSFQIIYHHWVNMGLNKNFLLKTALKTVLQIWSWNPNFEKCHICMFQL